VFYRLLGVKSLTLFSTLLTAVSLPFLYGGVRRLFDREIALYSLVLYAFYPKFIVSAAIGMPESTSVAFLAVALYGVVQTQFDDGGTEWALLGGFALLCSFLMYVPAVVAAVLLSLYFPGVEFARHRRGASTVQSLQRLVSSTDWVAVVGPSLVGDVIHLIWGPIGNHLNTGMGSARAAHCPISLAHVIFISGKNYI